MSAKTGLILALTCLTLQIQSGMTAIREVASVATTWQTPQDSSSKFRAAIAYFI